MKIFSDSLANKGEGGEEKKADEDLALDSIGCTSNVVMLDHA